MNKTVLIVLMALMIATPCLAQELEPDGIFSLHGTLWKPCVIGLTTTPPFVLIGCLETIGFYQDTVYPCTEREGCNPDSDYTYIDSFLVSIVYKSKFEVGNVALELYILHPSGFGVYMLSGFNSGDAFGLPTCLSAIGIAFKVDDDWKPPECIPPCIPIDDIKLNLPDDTDPG